MKRRGWWVAGLVALLVGAGCGYRFTARGGELPGGVRSVSVPMFANATAEPAAGAYFTDAAREEFARAGTLAGEASDAVLEGEVTRISVVPGIIVSFNDANAPRQVTQVASYRVVAAVRLRLVSEGKTLREFTVSDGEDFRPGNGAPGGVTAAQSTLETEGNRRVALRRLAATLMRQGFESLTSGL